MTARVLGELPERSVVWTLQDLHFDLLGGRTGRTVNGIGAACLLVMCLTGLVIWWPGVAGWRRGFTVDFARGWKRLLLGLAPPLLCVTGVVMWWVRVVRPRALSSWRRPGAAAD